MNQIMTKNKSLHLMLCGGAAINVGMSLFQPKDLPKNDVDDGFAEIKTTFIDTSRSNIKSYIGDDFYLIEGTTDDPIDGSGKVRATNYRAVSQAVPNILHKHKPGDLNVVVHSASGGSGSVCGPVLVSELLSQGKDVIVIQIGSTACEQEIRNTISTIQSYQGISEKRGKAVVSIYLENNKETPMVENDARARVNTLLLAAVWSGKNQGLDSQDLDHFLNYDKVSKFPPALTGLSIYSAGVEADIAKGQAVSSMITLIREGEDPTPDLLVGYHSFGTISDSASKAVKVPTPFHLMTVQGYFTNIVSRLQEKLSEAEEQYRVNPVHGLNMSSVKTQDDGMVL